MSANRTPICRRCGETDPAKLYIRPDRIRTTCQQCETAYKREWYARRAEQNRKLGFAADHHLTKAERGERVVVNPWHVIHDPYGTLTGAELYAIEVAYGLPMNVFVDGTRLENCGEVWEVCGKELRGPGGRRAIPRSNTILVMRP